MRLSVPLALALAQLASSPASAAGASESIESVESQRRGLSLSAGPELQRFEQGSQGPPLCCGERDSWSATGAAVSMAAAYSVMPWLAPGLELALGFARGGESSSSRELDARLFTKKAVLRLDFFVGEELAFAPHLGWYVLQVEGKFDDTAAPQGIERSGLFMGPGVGAGVDYRASRQLGFRVDAALAFIPSKADGSSMASLSFRAVWWPGL